MIMRDSWENTEISDAEMEYFIESYKKWSEKHKKLFKDAGVFYKGECSMADPLEIYGGYASEQINDFLRGKITQCAWTGLINTIRLSILSAPRISRNILVYRWVPTFVVNEMLSSKTKTYIEQGFLSTSLRPLERELYLKGKYQLLRIQIPAGTPAAYIDLIVNRNEKELLFLDGCGLGYDGKAYYKPLRRPIYDVYYKNYPLF